MSEFDLIAKYFLPLSNGHEEARGLGDDGAVLRVPDGQEIVLSTDMYVRDVHFLEIASPSDIAHKVLGASISDLAAMGATPHCYQLGISLPDKDEQWLKEFTRTLASDQDVYGIFLSGGDTTKILGGVCISITAAGFVPCGGAVGRSGAKVGDVLVISGAVGDAHIGLQVLKGAVDTQDDAYFINAHYCPKPRLDLAKMLRIYAHAAIDISDGLIADVGHICTSSKVGAAIQICEGMISPQAQKLLSSGDFAAQDLLGGGDDYELAIALAPQDVAAFIEDAKELGIRAYVAGVFQAEKKLRVLDRNKQELKFKHAGWEHF